MATESPSNTAVFGAAGSPYRQCSVFGSRIGQSALFRAQAPVGHPFRGLVAGPEGVQGWCELRPCRGRERACRSRALSAACAAFGAAAAFGAGTAFGAADADAADAVDPAGPADGLGCVAAALICAAMAPESTRGSCTAISSAAKANATPPPSSPNVVIRRFRACRQGSTPPTGRGLGASQDDRRTGSSTS